MGAVWFTVGLVLGAVVGTVCCLRFIGSNWAAIRSRVEDD